MLLPEEIENVKENNMNFLELLLIRDDRIELEPVKVPVSNIVEKESKPKKKVKREDYELDGNLITVP